jgi:hypothetical protein
MRRTLSVLTAAALTVMLAGCQQTRADMLRDADFAKSCTESGGHVYYIGFASEIIRCDFTTQTEGDNR